VLSEGQSRFISCQLSTWRLFSLLKSPRQLEKFPLDAQVVEARRDEKLARLSLVWMRVEVARLQERRRHWILKRPNSANRKHLKHQRPHCDLEQQTKLENVFSPINCRLRHRLKISESCLRQKLSSSQQLPRLAKLLQFVFESSADLHVRKAWSAKPFSDHFSD
jgi:hypothetical protein